ncbi:MAG: ATP-binding protein [Bacteroidota bacterium]
MKTKIDNPFLTTTYQGAEYFCDRQNETANLLDNITNGNSTTLFASRRIGKTGLIHHVINQLPKNWIGIYVDILQTENLSQFFAELATAIAKSQSENNSFGRKFINFIKQFRPIMSFDNLTGVPQFSFNIDKSQVEQNIESLFQFLEQQNFKTIIAIDEFQQITNYPEKNTEAWLRSKIQQLKNIVFIFSGSRQHIMSEMFTSSKRPFYRSTQLLKLEKIDKQIYSDFVIYQFEKYNKQISSEITNIVIDWANTHTYYVQQIFNRIFSATKSVVTELIWKQEALRILEEQETVFLTYRNMLTKPQWKLLEAIALEGIVEQVTSKTFIEKHKLGSSATVLRSLKTLLDDELIYYDFDINGNKFYGIYDVWLQRWFENKYN